MKTDVLIRDEGTIVVFESRTKAALQWIKENVSAEPWQWLGRSLCVDQRYADGLVSLLREGGFCMVRT